MIRNYTFIAISFILGLTFISVDVIDAQQPIKTTPIHDFGFAAFQRGHYRVALYDFESRATQGDFLAQFRLAYMYRHGYGMKEPNAEKALELYEEAAKQGWTPAQNNLGVLYVRLAESAAEKSEYQKNMGIAENWFKKAAEFDTPPTVVIAGGEGGYAPAQYNLYIIGSDNPTEWLRKAAENDYAPAQHQLGYLYINDKDDNGKVKYPKKALEWIQKAAEQGYPPAQNALGVLYKEGIGVKQDDVKAVKWYKKASEQGNVIANFNLGQNYRLGEGVDKNLEKAIEYYFRAAKEDYIAAQNNLAMRYEEIYREGNNAESLEMACRWLLRAAQQGQPIAQKNIGTYFERGFGVGTQDVSEAYYWYSLAIRDKDSLEKSEDNPKAFSETVSWRESITKSLRPEEKTAIDNRIENWTPKQFNGSGTGFYISKHYILTNAHVVLDENGKKRDEFRIPFRRVELIDWDGDVDLALLYDKLGNADTATFRLEHVKSGEKVTVFGYPQSDRLSYEGNIAPGNVSGQSYIVDHPQFENRFQHTAPTQRGNSGGPVFDSAGNVIGVSVEYLPDYLMIIADGPRIGKEIPYYVDAAQNINFAIKYNVIHEFVKFVRKNSNSRMRLIADLDQLTVAKVDQSEEVQVTDIPLTELHIKAKNFTVPVVCFKNKEEPPLDVVEISIED